MIDGSEALSRFSSRTPNACDCQWLGTDGGGVRRECKDSCCCDAFGCHTSKCSDCDQCVREGYRWCNGKCSRCFDSTEPRMDGVVCCYDDPLRETVGGNVTCALGLCSDGCT
mmetsp:Transcript_51954/g.123040  ORF Transcript_51954/g.123040 Transcript_51954/m.123040 type:complete len:112 (+) Transcript_51954:195-530(+)